MTQREDVRNEVSSMTHRREDVRTTNNMMAGGGTLTSTNGVRRSRSDSVSSSDLSQVIDEALIETNVNQNFVVVEEPSIPSLGKTTDRHSTPH